MNEKYANQDDALTEVILESISDGVFTVDHHWRITSFNRAAEEITGVDRKEAMGRYCWEVFRSNMCEGDCALKRTMNDGKSFVSSSTSIINKRKKLIPISVSTSLLVNDEGEVLGGVEIFRDHSLVEELRRDLSGSAAVDDMVSRSQRMQDIFVILDQIGESDSSVLITGETGTGKELMARAIHNHSARKDQPFVTVNCGALPDNLLESELFGYKAGAFTDARTDRQGLFGAADNGTILLDEIGETSTAFQVKLLRVLEEGEYTPLGSSRPLKTNVRVIAATNRDLQQMAGRGEFRRDLFYRINVINVALPPLRERSEDILVLAERFIEKMNRRKNKMISGLSPEAAELITAHHYPGNIRELENIIEHAFVLCRNGEITPDHLPASLFHPDGNDEVENEELDLKTAAAAGEKEIILKALRQNGYNRTAAAARLGMHKSTLFRKIKRLGISLPTHTDGRRRP
ncbi:MAG: sigma 54-interacting transcriptional regulator [Desulfofustis sp.]|jgi:PAS domain S-box-containing protein